MSDLFDSKQQLFKDVFNAGTNYEGFLQLAKPDQKERWDRSFKALELPTPFRETAKTFKRKLNILMLAGAWCGDCVKHCPIVVKIAEASEVIDLRVIDNQKSIAVRDELRIHGAARVPVIIGLSEDFFEVGRFGERPLSTYRRKAEKETGAACAVSFGVEPADELTADITGWFEVIERWQLILRTSGMLRTRYSD